MTIRKRPPNRVLFHCTHAERPPRNISNPEWGFLVSSELVIIRTRLLISSMIFTSSMAILAATDPSHNKGLLSGACLSRENIRPVPQRQYCPAKRLSPLKLRPRLAAPQFVPSALFCSGPCGSAQIFQVAVLGQVLGARRLCLDN